MLKRNVALFLLAGLIAGGGAAAWARSDGSRPTLAATTAASAGSNRPAAGTRARGLLGRVIHGNLIVRGAGGNFTNVVYDRGKEKSLSGDKLTITRPDGVDVTVTLTSTTKYRGVLNSSQLQTGRATLVLSNPDGSALTVAQPNGARAGNGAGSGARANAGTPALSGFNA
jgi:hypothetical protein